MRSFAIIVAALSFGALSWAAPVPEAAAVANIGLRDVVLPRVTVKSEGETTVDPRNMFSPAYVKRSVTPEPLESILLDLLDALKPHTDKLSACTSEEANTDYLTGIVEDIVKLIEDAVTLVLELVGHTLEEILTTREGGILDCAGLAKLLADVIHIVCLAVGLVINIVTDVLRLDVFKLLCLILVSLAKLLSCVLDLVADLISGVLAAVIDLVGDVLWVVQDLGVTELLALLVRSLL